MLLQWREPEPDLEPIEAGPPMTVVDDELQRVWALVSELSLQLSNNREATAALKRQAGELKGQTTGLKGLGFSLRRFNTDISKGRLKSLANDVADTFQRPLNPN